MSTTTFEPQVLVDLGARAIASEKDDRPAWLAARRRGVTATEVRDLHLGKITPLGLVQQKRAGDAKAAKGEESERDLGRVAVIGWGRQREQVLAERLRGQGIRPEHRVFHAEHDSRKLASPDGVGVDFDERLEVSEIKTGAPRYFGHDGMVEKGYLAQQVWSMDVLGAHRSRYVFEERIDGPDGYEPGEVYMEWVVLDDHRDLLAELHALADEVLRLLDDADAVPDLDEDIDVWAVNYLHALDREKTLTVAAKEAADAKKAATEAKVAAFAKVRELAGPGRFQQESLLARVTKAPDDVEPGEDRVVDEEHEDVIAARAAVVDAQAALAAVLESHTSIQKTKTTKPGRLTITSPQKRKAKA